MNGPAHYREAERLLTATTDETPYTYVDDKLAAAQVHATLALAAATVFCVVVPVDGREAEKWKEAVL